MNFSILQRRANTAPKALLLSDWFKMDRFTFRLDRRDKMRRRNKLRAAHESQ
jgi:hypothetical protein